MLSLKQVAYPPPLPDFGQVFHSVFKALWKIKVNMPHRDLIRLGNEARRRGGFISQENVGKKPTPTKMTSESPQMANFGKNFHKWHFLMMAPSKKIIVL